MHLSMTSPVFNWAGIMDHPDMPWVESSSEAPGHLRVSVGFFNSLLEIVVGPDVLVHLM